MDHFKSSAELKASAKEHMFGKYGTAIGAYLLIMLIQGFAQLLIYALSDLSTVAGNILYYAILFIFTILTGLFSSGTSYFFLKVACDRPLSVSDIFYGFKLCPDKALLMMGWITVLDYAAMIPRIILTFMMTQAIAAQDTSRTSTLLLPYALAYIFSMAVSVIVSLFYSQAFFLLHDFPQSSATELLRTSRKLMVGHKGRLFYLYVSFLPLYLLSLFSCGIALLWVIPYVNTTEAEFFLDIIKKS